MLYCCVAYVLKQGVRTVTVAAKLRDMRRLTYDSLIIINAESTRKSIIIILGHSLVNTNYNITYVAAKIETA